MLITHMHTYIIHNTWYVLVSLICCHILYSYTYSLYASNLQSFLASILQFKIILASLLQWTGSVRFHLLWLHVRTGSKIACSKINHGLRGLYGSYLITGLGRILLLLQSGHLLSFAHFKHLVFRWAHLKTNSTRLLYNRSPLKFINVLTSKTCSSCSPPASWEALAV